MDKVTVPTPNVAGELEEHTSCVHGRGDGETWRTKAIVRRVQVGEMEESRCMVVDDRRSC
jgi:hypothetical protein